MPIAAPRSCTQYPCRNMAVLNGRCAQHAQRFEQQRGTSTQRGYDGRWRKARIAWLAEHWFCVACRLQGRMAAASEVDHIKPHRGDMDLFWDQTNWQSLCKACHSRKTASESGWAGRVGQISR